MSFMSIQSFVQCLGQMAIVNSLFCNSINNKMADAKQEQAITTKTQQANPKAESKHSNLLVKPAEQVEVTAPQGYKFIKTIGDGSFGKVKLGIHIMTDQKVAIKILCKQRIRERTDIERISRQIKIMKAVRHPFIVQMYEIIESPKYLFLVMEYIEGGDLFDQISNASKLSEDRCKKIFSQILLGLEYLHINGITHRDMKPENILMEAAGIIKIADFGLGNFFSGNQKLKTACGSPCYAPPEMLNQQDYDPRKVDIWSSGIILYAMVHGYLPFEDDVTSLLYEKIKTKNVRVASWVSIPCRNLLRGLLAKSQVERWDMDTIKKHEFLYESVEFEKKYVAKQIQSIDEIQFRKICDHLGIMEEERLLGNLKKNKHNNLTTLYYLGKKKYLREKDNIQEPHRQQSVDSESLAQPIPELPKKDAHQQNINIYSFFDKEQPKKIQVQEQAAHSQIKQQSLVLQEKIEHPEQQHSQITDFPNAASLQESIVEPRPPPQEIAQTPKTNQTLKSSVDISHQKKQTNEQSSKDIKSQKPPTKSFHSHPTKKPPVVASQIATKKPEKVQKKDEKAVRFQNKGLKKSERMPIYKPKQEVNKLNESQVKLYQRSHSKDRPIILKNNLKTEPFSSKGGNQRHGTVIGKLIHIEPHLLDVDRIVLCSGQKFCQILEKRGFNGRIEYFNYDKQAIFLAKINVKLNKSVKGAPILSIEKIMSEINQNY